jgi:hypothetical protein
MNIFELAKLSIQACGEAGIDHMVTGAFATNFYSIPRSTRDIDIVLDVGSPTKLNDLIDKLSGSVEFSNQVVYDTISWGKRHVGTTRKAPYLKVELFELFDHAFVISMFERKKKIHLIQLNIDTYSGGYYSSENMLG